MNAQDNEIKHGNYIAGYDDGILFRKSLHEWEDWDFSALADEDYARGFTEATGVDYRSELKG